MAPSNGVFSQTDKDPQRTHPTLPPLSPASFLCGAAEAAHRGLSNPRPSVRPSVHGFGGAAAAVTGDADADADPCSFKRPLLPAVFLVPHPPPRFPQLLLSLRVCTAW